jgi:hypothetical protein
MIVATPNYIVTYRGINKKGQLEDGVMLSPVHDIDKALARDGYKNIEIVNVRPL